MQRLLPARAIKRFLHSLLLKIILSVLLLALFGLVVRGGLFDIKSIDCKSQFGPCDQKEEEKLNVFLDKNLFTVGKKDVNQALAGNFMNKAVNIQRVFPNRLVVNIKKRKALVAIKIKGWDEGMFLLDKEGVVVDFVKSSGLPSVILNNGDGLIVGKKSEPNLDQVVKILYTAYKAEGIKIAQLEDGKLSLITKEGVEAIFPLDGDFQVLVGALQLILSRSRIDGKLPKTIDLRYSNPVLRY